MPAQLREKIAARPESSRSRVGSRAVIADAAGADEYGRTQRRLGDGRRQASCWKNPAVVKDRFPLRRPARLAKVGAGEINHRVGAVE